MNLDNRLDEIVIQYINLSKKGFRMTEIE